MSPHSDRYLLFVEYFNTAKFMSAQTTLDEIWLHEEGENKDFFGGLIQVAVALYHLTNGNPKGSQRIYIKAKGMLEKYGSRHLDLQLGKLIKDLDELFAKCEDDLTDLDFLKLVPQIEFEETGNAS